MTDRERQQLPLFHGREPQYAEIKLSGSAVPPDDDRCVLWPNDTAYLLVRVRVKGVNHELKGEEQHLVRTHACPATDLALLPTRFGNAVLDAARGTPSLLDPDRIVTDERGRPLRLDTDAVAADGPEDPLDAVEAWADAVHDDAPDDGAIVFTSDDVDALDAGGDELAKGD